MEIINDKEIENVILVIRFSSSQNNYSCRIPKNWTLKILKKFIAFSFKQEIKNTFSLIYSGKILSNENQVISSIFKNDEKLYQIFVSGKNEPNKHESKLENNLKDPKKFDITQTSAFQLAEKGLILNTFENLLKLNINGLNSAKNFQAHVNLDHIGKMPLFSTQLKDRISHETRKNRLNIISFEDTIIENYPIKDYFKYEIIFRLVMFFILFGFQMKGYNLPIFISLLILYYWYDLYCDIKTFYTTKEEAIKRLIKETDPKIVEAESEESSEYEFSDGKSESVDNKQLTNEALNQEANTNLTQQKFPEENMLKSPGLKEKLDQGNKKKSIETNENLIQEEGFDPNNVDKINQYFDSQRIKPNQSNLDNIDDIKIDSDINMNANNKNIINESENLININNPSFVNRKISDNNASEVINNNITDKNYNNNNVNEINDIGPMLEKMERKKRKKENIPEGPIKYVFTFFIDIIVTFFLSLIPAWSDEFENNNPIIQNIAERANNLVQNENIQNVNDQNINNQEEKQNNNNQAKENLINNERNHIGGRIEQEDNQKDLIHSNFKNNTNNIMSEMEKYEVIEEERKFDEIEDTGLMKFKKIHLKEPHHLKEQDQHHLDSNNSLSEKHLNKSANENKLVSELDPIRRKIVINDDNGSKNENEFVFPENLNLDNLSYNEGFVENNKKKDN